MDFAETYAAVLDLVGSATGFSLKVEATRKVPSGFDRGLDKTFGRAPKPVSTEVVWSIYVRDLAHDGHILTDDWPTPEQAIRELTMELAKVRRESSADVAGVGDPAMAVPAGAKS